MKKEILIINWIFSEHDLPITAFENNPAAHHLGTPGLNDIILIKFIIDPIIEDGKNLYMKAIRKLCH
jgi:hypothetical protein